DDPPVVHAPRRAPAPVSSSSSDRTRESTAATSPSAVADHAAPPTAFDISVQAPAVDPPRHSMVTRGKAGIVKPNPKYAFVAPTPVLSSVPSSVRVALRDPNWRAAMQQEFDALKGNRTWTLVPRPPGAKV